MENIKLLIDMGWSIDIENLTYSLSITIKKDRQKMVYDGSLNMSNPERIMADPSLLVVGGILVDLYKELFGDK